MMLCFLPGFALKTCDRKPCVRKPSNGIPLARHDGVDVARRSLVRNHICSGERPWLHYMVSGMALSYAGYDCFTVKCSARRGRPSSPTTFARMVQYVLEIHPSRKIHPRRNLRLHVYSCRANYY